MKIIIFCVILSAMLVSGCAAVSDSQAESSAASSSLASSALPAQSQSADGISADDQDGYQDVYTTYLETIDSTSIMSFAWANANEIDPNDFIMFYYQAVLSPANPYGWTPEMEVPAKEYEAYILQYFNTTAEHLRKSIYYNDTNDVYIFKCGIGGSIDSDILSVTSVENYLDIAYLQYDLGEHPIREGTIRIAIAGEQLEYVSNSIHDIDS